MGTRWMLDKWVGSPDILFLSVSSSEFCDFQGIQEGYDVHGNSFIFDQEICD